MGNWVFKRTLKPVDKTLVNRGRFESAASIDEFGEPFQKVFPELMHGVPRPILADVVANRSLDHVCRPLNVALRERHTLHMGVEQDELANIPGEAVSDSSLEGFAQGVLYQAGIEGMITLSRVRHLDLSGQNWLTSVTPVQPEVVPPRSARPSGAS